MVKPSYNSPKSSSIEIHDEKFVNREEFIEIFEQLRQTADKGQILNLYGLPGIGKSEIRKKFQKILEEENGSEIWISFSFEDNQTLLRALISLRQSLSRTYSIPFLLFDAAYYLYHEKIGFQPQLLEGRTNLNRIEELDLLNDVSSRIRDFTGVTTLIKFSKFVQRAYNYLNDWWNKHAPELYDFLLDSEKRGDLADADQMIQQLPFFLAMDLKKYLKDSRKILYIFIDRYETLWSKPGDKGLVGYYQVDLWLRELIRDLRDSPITWLIFGQQKLLWTTIDPNWSGIIKQKRMHGFDDKATSEYLTERGFKNPDIVRNIIRMVKEQEGYHEDEKIVPFYLKVIVNTNMNIEKPEDVKIPENTPYLLSSLLSNCLTHSEKETMRILAFARQWNQSLFKSLLSTHNTGYPSTGYTQFCKYFEAYLTELQEGYFCVHSLLRNFLTEDTTETDPILVKDVHCTLWRFYVQKLNNISLSEVNLRDLNEAAYHKFLCSDDEDTAEWYLEVVPPFEKAGNTIELLSTTKNVINSVKDPTEPLLSYLASIHIKMKQFNEAISQYEHILQVNEEKLGTNHPKIADILNVLALAYSEKATTEEEYNKVEEIFRRSISIFDPFYFETPDINGPFRPSQIGHTPIPVIIRNYVRLLRYRGKFSEALFHIQRAFNIAKHTIMLGSDILTIVMEFGQVLEDIGNLIKAEEIYKSVLRMVRQKTDNPDLKYIINKLGLFYLKIGRFKDAENLLIESLKIREKEIGSEHPATAIALDNLASYYREVGKFTEAEKLYKKAIELFRNTLGENHFDYATACFNYSLFCELTGDIDSALKWVTRCIKIREKVYGKTSTYLYEPLQTLLKLYSRLDKIVEKGEVEQKLGLIFEKEPRFDLSQELGNIESFEELINHPKMDQLLHEFLHHKKKSGILKFIDTLYGVASNFTLVDMYSYAEQFYKQGLDLLVNISEGNPIPRQIDFHIALGEIYIKKADHKNANDQFKLGSKLFKRFYGENHPKFANLVIQKGMFYEMMGKLHDAFIAYTEALSIVSTLSDRYYHLLHNSLLVLARILQKMEKFPQAAALYEEEIFPLLEENYGDEDHVVVARALQQHGTYYYRFWISNPETDIWRIAEEKYLKSLVMTENVSGDENEQIALISKGLGRLYNDTNQRDKAIQYYKRAIHIYEKIFQSDHPVTLDTYSGLAVIYVKNESLEEAEIVHEKILSSMKRAPKSYLEIGILLDLILFSYELANIFHQKTDKNKGMSYVAIMEELLQIATSVENFNKDKVRKNETRMKSLKKKIENLD